MERWARCAAQRHIALATRQPGAAAGYCQPEFYSWSIKCGFRSDATMIVGVWLIGYVALLPCWLKGPNGAARGPGQLPTDAGGYSRAVPG